MPARFRGTSSRSARLEFGAELERGRALPLPRPAANRSWRSGMRKLRERAGCKRHAWPVPASSVKVDGGPCQSGYTVSVSSAARAAGNADTP